MKKYISPAVEATIIESQGIICASGGGSASGIVPSGGDPASGHAPGRMF